MPATAGRPESIVFMKNHLVEKAVEILPDPQVLVNVVSKRLRQLNTGRPPLVPPVITERYGNADYALQELIEGKLIVQDPE